MEELLTVDQVAKLVKMSRATIYRRMKEGKFPQPLRMSPKKLYWTPSVITAYLDELKREAARDTAAARKKAARKKR